MLHLIVWPTREKALFSAPLLPRFLSVSFVLSRSFVKLPYLFPTRGPCHAVPSEGLLLTSCACCRSRKMLMQPPWFSP